MEEVSSRRGLGVWAIERSLRKRMGLKEDERIVEWKQGRLRRWLVDGSDQPIPRFGVGRLPTFSGLTRLSYSPSRLFIYSPDKFPTTDLAFIVHIWHSEPRSVCIIYSTFDEQSHGSPVLIRWDSDENESAEELVRFSDRIRVRARRRRASFSAEWQERIKSRLSEVTASPSFETELALVDESAAEAYRLKPCTVVGQLQRALVLGMDEERDRLIRQLNGGKPGWNDDEPGFIEVASELAARRFFRSRATTDQIAAYAAQWVEADRLSAEQRPAEPTLPELSHVEAVIRKAAGDKSLALDGISPSVVFQIRGAFIGVVILELDLTFEVNKLICDAETLAFERGFNPPLAVEVG